MKRNAGVRQIRQALLAIALYILTSHYADAWRGYDAVGGEVLLLTLPLWWDTLTGTLRGMAKELLRELTREVRQ